MTTLARTIEVCFSPVGMVTLLFVAGLVATACRRGPRLGHRLVWAGVSLYLIFLFSPLAEVLVSNLEQPFPPMHHPDASAGVRAVVVLSGYGEDTSLLSVTSKLSMETVARMAEGVRLYRELPGVQLVVSGGVRPEGKRPVAELMADLAKAMGVPEGDVVIERTSKTTYENLVEVRKIVGSEPFILVTSAGHLRRATGVARNLGMKAVAAPAVVWSAQRLPAGLPWLEWSWTLVKAVATPSTSRFVYLQLAYHEYIGYAWYWMLGRVG